MNNPKTPTLECLISSIFVTKRLLIEKYKKLFGTDVTFIQFEVLKFIEEKKHPSMREVASFLCITPPSATVLIDNLIKSGLVIREQDPEDRRAIHLLLTNRGKIFIQKSNRRQSDLAKKMMRCLSPLERQTIYHLHTKLQNLLKV